MMDIIDSNRLRFGAYEADVHTHELWKHGTRIKLVGQPFEILTVLLKRPGQLVTREELRGLLWPGDTFVDFNHGLNAAVNKLRDALCDSAEDPKYIETLPRRGYRFIAQVEQVVPASVAESRPKGADETRARTAALEPAAAAMLPAVEGRTSGRVEAEVVAPAAIEPGQPRTGLRWLRFALVTAALVLAAWRFANVLHPWMEDKAKHIAEAAPPGTLTPLTGLADRTSQAAFSPDGTHVAFHRDSFVPGNSGIWIKQVGGEELVQLTTNVGDHRPVWSPDGRSVAFSRLSGEGRGIYRVPARGGAAQLLYETPLVQSEIDWSPDGEVIAFTSPGKQGRPAIFLLTNENHSTRPLTSPPEGFEDWGPSFSPDGNQIAFVRSGNIMVMPAEGGELRRLTPQPVGVQGSPAWTPDGKSILFAARSEGEMSGLWRVLVSGGMPILIRKGMVWNPAASKRGFRLAFELFSSARSVDQMDLDPAGQNARSLLTSAGGENAGQQISPDGRKIAFQSDRTGALDIWACDRNGQNLIQLTAMGTAGAPRWSPDGKEIAFDVGLGRSWQEARSIFVVDADGGSARSLVQDNFSNNVPSWSSDGKWVYFASNRTGDWQVWKAPASGGALVQVTKEGGFASIESPDGQYLYYAKHNYDNPVIWRVPVAGGEETPIYPGIHPLDWGAWTLVRNGLLFVDRDESGLDVTPKVRLYEFSKQSVRTLALLEKPPFWVTATHDGKSVLFDQPGEEESHIMLLENFR
jgi:Tol biopolymer transport system component/DNA-binding winged helix-turn-helix (wHTH) protein